ncbi:MAG TPA: CIA30 family protein, partial [Bacteroidetes bacterium]|nr:CIA30 family protein [Bacteroidota bacterium]
INQYHSYVYDFQTNGEWQTVTIPLAKMYPSFRGRKLNIPNFNHSQLEEIAFLIGNKKAESFELMIDKVELK